MHGVCEARGEIDFSAVPAFVTTMRAAIDQAKVRDVFIDCRAVTFMDSSGFHALADANGYAIENGHRLVIVNLPPNCARVVRLCDVAGDLTIAE